jgi:adenosylcobyric acid synthase
MGRTESASPWLKIVRRSEDPVEVPDGALSREGRIWGCYLHGLFENGAFRRAWLQSLGWEAPCLAEHVRSRQEAGFERLADAVEAALDMRLLEGLL